jgi:hypothetical protein
VGEGYRSQSSRVVRFGLGGIREIEDAEIAWPGRRRVRLERLAADRIHDVPPPP